MADSQNNFYTSISKYYSEIFPFNPIQQVFVKKEIGDLQDKNMLDIGCATGELAFRLAESGAKVTGIDLNDDLLQQARAKSADKNSGWETTNPNLKFRYGNMLELKADFRKEQFDAVLCFGNTLAHLNSTELIEEMLEGVKAVLKPGGQLLLQILNYDYICSEPVSELPLIETENIKFIRRYNFKEDSDLIDFITDLEIKGEGKTVSNKTPLLALKSKEFNDLLVKTGFQNIKFYANFKQDAFGGKHIPLVVSCMN